MTGLTVQSLRNNRCQCKGIPYSKIGSSIRYKVEDVIAFMEGHRIIPMQEEKKLNFSGLLSKAADLIGIIFKTVSILKVCLDIFKHYQL